MILSLIFYISLYSFFWSSSLHGSHFFSEMKKTRKVSNLIHNDVQNIVELIRLLIYVSSLMSLLEIQVVESQVSSAYNPTDNIAIDCGSLHTQEVEHRHWEGDVGSKYLHNNNNDSFISAAAASPTRVDSVPYSTARLSHSRFTYSIPLKPGQKFLRLYFYPVHNYDPNVKISNALFSVQVGRYTLLSNFNATQTAVYFGKEGFVKEFCINIDDSKILNITFIPNTSAPNSFAFINGIEVVSMPTNLYHSSSNGIEFIGSSYLYTIGNDTALETIYRINVGGGDISAGEDTGMFRRWDKDDDYLTNRSEGNIAPLVEADFYLRFSMIKDYIAPNRVYKTARSSKELMIWEFPVDYGFYYLLRLHYCDIQIEPNSQCAFLVSVGKQNAQSITVDPTFWNRTIGKKVPIFIDSVIPILALESGGNKRHNLSIALEASPDQLIARHSTFAILNGLEIFKLNDTFGNLAGPNPEPIQTKTPNITVDNPFPNTNLSGPNPEPIQTSNDKSHKKLIKIGLTIGGVLVLLICGVISFFFFGRRTRKVKYFFTVETGSGTNNTRSVASSLPFQCRYFSLVEIKAVTNNFDDLSLIGVGGFGNVYKGHIDNGSCVVAIKRLKPESSQGAHEFKTEIELLSQLRHLHIVSLIGYCDQENEMILVYDYMAHGTLRDHLYLTDNPPLSWKQRLKICIGAARGLRYLHTDAKQVIIHRDVKTTNILLDDKWVAKVSDFGLSKIGPNTMSKAHVTTMVKGSIGYLDPEYYKRYQLTVKSDVYSFGVVLCEVICARPPIIQSEDEYQISLVEWFRTYHVNGTVDQIVDQEIRGKIAPQCLEKFGEIAMNCVLDSGNERPSMIEVVCGLEFALQLQENADDEIKMNDEMIIERDGSSGKGKEIYSGDINTMLSEIMDPKGR